MRGVVQTPIGVKEDWEVIAEFGEALGIKNFSYESIDDITNEIALSANGYEGITNESVGSLGIDLNREKESVQEIAP